MRLSTWTIVGALLAGQLLWAVATGVVRNVRRWRQEARRQAEEAEELRAKALVLSHGQTYVQGALSVLRGQPGPVHPGRVDDFREALARSGITEGNAVASRVEGGRPTMLAVVHDLTVSWSDEAEGIVVSYRLSPEVPTEGQAQQVRL